MPEPMIVADPALRTPPGSDYWTSPEMVDQHGAPTFSVQEVGKAFFGRSPGWVRAQLRTQVEVDGEMFRLERKPGGDRYFRLYDIERWAHGLAAAGRINGRHLELVIHVVRTNARLWSFIA
jgi:hypothetical protein